MSIDAAFFDAVCAALEPRAAEWLHNSLHSVVTANNTSAALLAASVPARRECGDELAQQRGLACPAHWTLSDAARIALLEHGLAKLEHEGRAKALKDFYRGGDEHEKAALLKGLCWLDPKGLAVQTAIQACRYNSLEVFRAVALHNPYPASHFAEINWNQLVLKSLFQNLDIAAIHDLDTRLNPKLSVMCADYAEEQGLAERSAPPSLWLAVRLQDLDDNAAEQALNRNLQHPDGRQRHAIADCARRSVLSSRLRRHCRDSAGAQNDADLRQTLLHCADGAHDTDR